MIDRLNSLSAEDLHQALLACCGSHAWAHAIAANRPYRSLEDLLSAASTTWFALPEPDWLEAFACHPRIGASQPQTTTAFLTHSTTEQAVTQRTLAAVASQLLEANRAYEVRFGFLYLVFASGRTAPELLDLLHQRLQHTREQELQEAARQQDRITLLRLERWLAP